MKTSQIQWTPATGWRDTTSPPRAMGATGMDRIDDAHLVLVFGGSATLDAARIDELRARFPGAVLAGCSTAGEILGERVYDDTVTATAVSFTTTQVRTARVDVPDTAASHAAGKRLGEQLNDGALAHVLVFSDGLGVNGSALTAGLRESLPAGVTVTGGLAGDGTHFAQTLVVADGPPRAGCVAAVGLYGTRLRIGHGSLGGWDDFGIDRKITRAQNNVLYELDGEPALALYQRYLGAQAAGLPATGLLFPLALHDAQGGDLGLVRTLLAVNEAEQSITFAGDMPTGMYARMMKANFDRLVDGAAGAAAAAAAGQSLGNDADLALLISCVGRRLVLKQRVEDELDGVRRVLGPRPVLTGFYSYGEISPYAPTGRCELHNQTMTVTTLSED